YPHAMDDHQTANAAALARAGGARVFAEAALTAEELARVLRRLLAEAPGEAAAMAAAAHGLGRPDAASDLADLVETLHKGAPA
ncbi:MAG: glycosyltransferase, partial [Pseudomonadota bacterium]